MKHSSPPKRTSLLLAMLLALTMPAQAEAPPSPAKLFEDCKVAAEKGTPSAQFAVGLGYLNGVGVAVDEAKGVMWLRQAGEQGHLQAQFFLASCYVKGMGCEKDQAEAVKWFRKAAEQGHPRAQFELGYCYWSGKGVEVDKALAAPWLRKASAQGVVDAHFVLGACYRFGRGVPKDLVEAYAYYILSELASDDPRKLLLDLLKEKMTPEEIAKGELRAKELKSEIQARLASKPAGK